MAQSPLRALAVAVALHATTAVPRNEPFSGTLADGSPAADALSSPEGYPIKFDGNNIHYSKRNVVTSVPWESTYAFPKFPAKIGTQTFSISTDGKYAIFKLNEQIVAGVAKHFRQPHSMQHYGLSNLVIFPNTASMVTKKPFVMIASKELIVEKEGWSSDEAKEEAAKEQEAQSWYSRWLGQQWATRHARDTAFFVSWVCLAFSGFLEAMFDTSHGDAIDAYAKTPAASSEVTLARRWTKASTMVSKAQSMVSQYGTKPALMSENMCIHWEQDNGIVLTKTHVKLPLNKPITTVSGRGSYLPYNALFFSRGTTVFKWDPLSDTLLIHIAYPMLFWYGGQIFQPNRADLYVGPVDDDTEPVSTADQRPISTPAWASGMGGFLSMALRASLSTAHSLPADFTRFSAPVSERCSADDLAEIQKGMTQPSGQLPYPLSLLPDGLSADMATMWTNVQWTYKMVLGSSYKTMDCSTTYFAPAQGGLDDVRATEMAILQHMVHEIPKRFELITAQYWNDGVSSATMNKGASKKKAKEEARARQKKAKEEARTRQKKAKEEAWTRQKEAKEEGNCLPGNRGAYVYKKTTKIAIDTGIQALDLSALAYLLEAEDTEAAKSNVIHGRLRDIHPAHGGKGDDGAFGYSAVLDNGTPVLVFAGTDPAQQDDISADLESVISEDVDLGGEMYGVAKGFNRHFQALIGSLEAGVATRLSTHKELIISGHSLGGAIANIAAVYFANKYDAKVMLRTFGAPRTFKWSDGSVTKIQKDLVQDELDGGVAAPTRKGIISGGSTMAAVGQLWRSCAGHPTMLNGLHARWQRRARHLQVVVLW